MSELDPILIDLAESFPHLSNAPIVEAVIDLRARALSPWDEAPVMERLKNKLPEYPTRKSVRGFSATFSLHLANQHPVGGVAPAGEAASDPSEDRGWVGARIESPDGLNIATFTRDGFSFSRLRPYEDWDTFSREAMRLWDTHTEIARPKDIQRLGVRCINRIEVPVTDLRFDDYLQDLGGGSSGLPTGGFMHQDILGVPGHPYAATLIRTMQPPETPQPASLSLIIDVDVFCPEPFPIAAGTISSRLAEMHWVRNKVFFGSITTKTKKLFQ